MLSPCDSPNGMLQEPVVEGVDIFDSVTAVPEKGPQKKEKKKRARPRIEDEFDAQVSCWSVVSVLKREKHA